MRSRAVSSRVIWLRLALLAVVVGLAPTQYPAQAGDSVAKGSPSFAVPESPAFTYLNTTPAKIAQPGNVRDLALELIHAVDEGGKLKQGFAVSVRPWQKRTSLTDYQSPGRYILYNTEVSFGTAKASGDSGATEFALGVRMTLFDDGDPMLNDAYIGAVKGAITECKPSGPGGDQAAQLKCMSDAKAAALKLPEVRNSHVKKYWNRTRLSLGLATGWTAAESIIGNAEWTGWRLWLAGGSGLGTRWAQLVGQVNYTDNAHVDEKAKPNEFGYGARMFVGTGHARGFVELTGTNMLDVPSGADGSKGDWSSGVEFKVSDAVWLSTGLGSPFATGSDNPVKLLLNLKWSISDESKIDPLM